MPFYVYILASKRNGTLYTGVTNNLARRVFEHKTQQGSRFTSQYNVSRLVYFEEFQRGTDAIAHEKRLKRWRRPWKIEAIERGNPNWDDLLPPINS
ncbi:GIY-YIG nuclease family protein [Flexibacterium corallicola]|uniref:GIY-YIG nuclease family protein n=1 Tax=Flexibacterium corallicola TaxID=3037259 RepID=UPI00286F0DC6|nr:GIY-YIG nuclease family protein [Pseudovibrio sp. M1P-2-3]